MKISKLIEEKLKDENFKEMYEAEGEKLETAVALYKAREAAGLTQAELAERAHTTQATIARIERGDNVSFDKLSSIAHAMGKKLKVDFA
ncbi:putative transcriptional regulator [Enterococcus sp. PF1-24]|uniref:helix-turn-helix domain-containing protein n=1 Tax=unclassified Enterococcus TaxID=2608891 RepID=UPI002475652F|nr:MULTISPECIES: helix-turn-helix transcriptional regulator [unclassified Enterococcus]MDH6364504.1 putative transcriptional regulator [Enterococcus sp. PFB1-1]MDH6401619.1 putative transcriptional regulator [Enterococcus sp. PF1-24]